jgi:Bacterial aa3 type cytochrome c oxidase subunit IV
MSQHEYHRGEMDISDQTATWKGFITGSTWGGLLIILSVGYATLALALGMNWMIALGLMAAVGVLAGLFLNLGGRWMATVVLLAGMALLVQGCIALFGALG